MSWPRPWQSPSTSVFVKCSGWRWCHRKNSGNWTVGECYKWQSKSTMLRVMPGTMLWWQKPRAYILFVFPLLTFVLAPHVHIYKGETRHLRGQHLTLIITPQASTIHVFTYIDDTWHHLEEGRKTSSSPINPIPPQVHHTIPPKHSVQMAEPKKPQKTGQNTNRNVNDMTTNTEEKQKK